MNVLNSEVDNSTDGFVDFGLRIRLPFSSMIPSLYYLSCLSKGVVSNFKNL